MKTVLMIAYYFPPIGGGGVQRSVKFARYLPEFGYRPVVVTGNAPDRSEHLGQDSTLSAELPRDLQVQRISAPEPPPASTWRGRAERWLRVDSAWRQWWISGATDAGLAAGGADVIFATMSPFASTEVAAALARRLGRPWVADLRDPWALDEMVVWPTAAHRRAERRRMRRSLRTAAAIVMNTAESGAALAQAFPELASRVEVITNGYDAADFEGPAPARSDQAFRIVHAGFLHTDAGRRVATRRLHGLLGGANADVDFLTRSHVYLLEAVDRVLQRRPELESTLEVHLVGPQSSADREASARFVRSHGYLPHDEAVAMLRTADMLFLPMHNLPSGHRARIVPGKTYEYVAAQRPILAAVPDGDARDLLAAAGTAILTRPDDVEAMAAAIVESVDARHGRPAPTVDPELLHRYERRELTRRLAGVLDRVSG